MWVIRKQSKLVAVILILAVGFTLGVIVSSQQNYLLTLAEQLSKQNQNINTALGATKQPLTTSIAQMPATPVNKFPAKPLLSTYHRGLLVRRSTSWKLRPKFENSTLMSSVTTI